MSRRSLSMDTAAEMLDTSADTIRRMLERGDLRGHYLNRKRKVYADSITDYQDGHAIQPKAKQEAPPKRSMARGDTEAARDLRKLGI